MSDDKEFVDMTEALENFGSDKLPVETSSYEGLFVNTSIAMEPGIDFGNKYGNFYQVDATGIAIYNEHMTFSSFQQLVEFRNHLTEYINTVIRRNESELDFFKKKYGSPREEEEIEDLD